MSSSAPAVDQQVVTDELSDEQQPWVTIVWNDPVNLMSYVTHVFMSVLGHPRPRAEKLMLDVHHRGKATVSSGTKDKVEGDVVKLQAAGLWATMSHDR